MTWLGGAKSLSTSFIYRVLYIDRMRWVNSEKKNLNAQTLAKGHKPQAQTDPRTLHKLLPGQEIIKLSMGERSKKAEHV